MADVNPTTPDSTGMGNPPSPSAPSDTGSPPATTPPPLESFIPTGGQGPSTPSTAGVTPSPTPKMPNAGKAGPGINPSIIGGIIVIIIVAAVGYTLLSHHVITPGASSTTTVVTSTVTRVNVQNIMQCTSITQPGTYNLLKNISTSISSGPCINVESSNVKLVGNGNGVNGNGPFVGTPPFTYGILLNHVNNVTVTDFSVTSFSYGIYSNDSTNSTIVNNTLQKITMSGIALSGSTDNHVSKNTVLQVASRQGGISLSGGGHNLVLNNSADNNAYYGFVINSTNNTFNGNMFKGNPIDLLCNASAGLVRQNSFTHSNCEVNQYCNFAYCSITNSPTNISAVTLGTSISSCGGINAPGFYTLSDNLDMRNYVNTSEKMFGFNACVTINSSNVNLNCNGMSISNGVVGISAIDSINFTVNNCRLYNNTYGIYTNGDFDYNISNTQIKGSDYGFYSSNSTKGTINNVTATDNTYGTFIGTASAGLLFNNFKALNNTYGAYVNGGGGNAFSGGKLLSNTKSDLYCTRNTYNQTTDLFQSTTCGVTDCNWGKSCSQHGPPPLALYPISSCSVLKSPGNYIMTSGISNAEGACINIASNNVNLNCNGNKLSGVFLGSAFYVAGRSNVSIENCSAERFQSAVSIINSSYVTIDNFTAFNVTSGITVDNALYSRISDVNTSFFIGKDAFVFNGLSSSVVKDNIVFDSLNSSSTGYFFTNAKNNLVTLNSGSSAGLYGMFFNNTRDNTIFNNSMFLSGGFDYYCSPDSSGPYKNNIGINNGSTKFGCTWLVEQNPAAPTQECLAISSSQDISLAGDLVYPYGTTCFNIFNTANTMANGTTVNCNWHTVLATHGGTFVDAVNTSSVTIENCYLMNFTRPVIANAPQFQAINNTLANSNTSILLSGAHSSTVEKNTILNSSSGIVVENTNYAKIENNNISNTGIGIEEVGGTGDQFRNNIARVGQIGMYIINTTVNFFQDNVLGQQQYGISCTQSAIGTNSLNLDQGGNICSSNSQCRWMTSSPQCAPT